MVERGATVVFARSLQKLDPARAASTAVRAIDLPAPMLAPYTEAQVRFAAQAWPMRAAQELRSARIFRALARAARVAGIVEPWPTCFDSAVRDEVRHARICADVGARLGAAAPEYDDRPVRPRLP